MQQLRFSGSVSGRRCVVALLVLAGGFTLAPPALAQNVLSHPGFETGSYASDLPDVFGQWAGDMATIVGAEQGVTPSAGSKMLRFDATDVLGSAAGLLTCDVLQLRDMTPWQPSIRANNVTVTASARVNRIAGPDVDTRFWLEVWAFQGVPSNFPVNPGAFIGQAQVNLDSDADPSTWEPLTVSLPLHRLTDYVAFYVYAAENVQNDGPPNQEFHGHYVDECFLRVDGGVETEPLSFGAVKSSYER